MKDKDVLSEKRFSVPEAAQIIGFSRVTGWREIERGHLGCYRVGGVIRVGEQHIQKYLLERENKRHYPGFGARVWGRKTISLRFALPRNIPVPVLVRIRVMRELLHQMIQAQPDAPTVMVESYWKQEPHDKEKDEHRPAAGEHQETDEVQHKDEEFGGDDVDGDGSDEEAFFTLKESVTARAMMSDLKGRLHDGLPATDGTTQPQAARDRRQDVPFAFHNLSVRP